MSYDLITRSSRAATALLACLVLVASCGSADEESGIADDGVDAVTADDSATSSTATAAPSESSTTTTEATTTTVDEAADNDIAEVVVFDQGAEPRTELRNQVEPGLAERAVLTQVQEITQEIDGITGPPIPAVGMIMDMEFLSASAGEGLVSQRSTIVAVRLVDDTDPALAAQLQTALDPMVGLVTEAVVDEQRREIRSDVIGLENIDPTVAALTDQLSNNSQLSVPLPIEAVGVGARWQVTQVLQLQGLEVRQTSTYDLVAIEGSIINLEVSVEQTVDPGSEMDLGGGQTATILSWQGTSNGSVALDLASMVPELTMVTTSVQELDIGPGAESTVVLQTIEVSIDITRP